MLGTSAVFPPYAQYSNEQLLDAFEQGEARLRRVIAGLTEEELRTRARGPARWSAHEIVIHAADSELQGVYRMRKIWAQPGCPLPGYDQDAWAREHDYLRLGSAAERANALDLLGALRRSVLPLLRRAQGADWERWGEHPEYGKVTLRNLLELYADHTERHAAQILEIRAILGKPVKFEMLLAERLY